MKCAEFRSEVVHVVLQQASAETVAACREHARLCAECRVDAEATADLLRGVRALGSEPASAGFRERLRRDVERERALEDQWVSSSAGIGDRVQASAAFVVHRLRQSRTLRVVTALAAVHLFALAFFVLRDRPGSPAEDVASVEIHREPRAPQAEPPPRVDVPPPTGPTIGPAPTADEDAVVDPLDYVDPHGNLAIPSVPELEPAPEELPSGDLQEQIEFVKRDNQLAQVRYLMRLRLNTSGELGPRVRDPADRAALRGMRWLVEQQEDDGSWNPGDYGGDPLARVGVTGLAVATLTVDAELGIPGLVQRDVVSRGLDFLRGAFDTRNRTFGRVVGAANEDALTLFNHALATLAFAEHHVLDPRDGDEALLWDALERLDDLGGRRLFRDLEPVDATTAPWMALAMETALASGVHPPFDLARATSDARSYVVRDLPPIGTEVGVDRVWQVVTASAIDPLFDGRRDDRIAPPSLDRLVAHLRAPEWREPTKIYFAALDMHQRGGEEWRTWRGEANAVLISEQESGGAWRAEYEWDPVSRAGGDLYATALKVMTLTVAYRLAR